MVVCKPARSMQQPKMLLLKCPFQCASFFTFLSTKTEMLNLCLSTYHSGVALLGSIFIPCERCAAQQRGYRGQLISWREMAAGETKIQCRKLQMVSALLKASYTGSFGEKKSFPLFLFFFFFEGS